MNAMNPGLAALCCAIICMSPILFFWWTVNKDHEPSAYGSLSFKTRNWSINIWPCNVPGSSLEGTFWIGAIISRNSQRQYQYLWKDGTWHTDIGSPEMSWPGCYTTENAAQEALREANEPTWLD